MAFPTAHLLVGFGVGEVAHARYRIPRWGAWIAAGAAATLPDIDVLLPIRHGTYTHSLVTIVLITALVWALFHRGWGMLVAAAWGSHLVLDLLDGRGPTNVYLGWPILRSRAIALADLFPDATRPLSVSDVPILLLQTALGGIGFMLLLVLARRVRPLRKR